MRKHAYLILALVLLLVTATLLSSCATPERCARKFPATTVIERVVEVRDTTITLPGVVVHDTLTLPWLMPCPDVTPVHRGTASGIGSKVSPAPALPVAPRLLGVARQGSATVRTYLQPDGRITTTCTCDSTRHTLKGALRDQITTDTRTRTVEVPVRGIVYWLGWVFIALIAGIVIFTLARRLK